MQADEALRLADTGGELGDRQRRGIGGNDAFVADLRGDLLQHTQFQVEIFSGRFDDQLRVLQAAVIGAGADFVEGRLFLLRRQGFLGDLPVQVFTDRCDGFLQSAFGYVEQGHVETGHGADLRDAVAHGARTDHPDVLQIHLPILRSNPAIPWPRLQPKAYYCRESRAGRAVVLCQNCSTALMFFAIRVMREKRTNAGKGLGCRLFRAGNDPWAEG